MIKSFAHKGLKTLFNDGIKKGIQTKHTEKLLDILDHLDATNEINNREKNMKNRKRPSAHPGHILKVHYIEPLNLTLTDLAKSLKVSRETLSKIVN